MNFPYKQLYLEDPVGLADAHVLVGEEGDVHVPQAALLAGPLNPGQVGEVGVCGAGNHLAAQLPELCRPSRYKRTGIRTT